MSEDLITFETAKLAKEKGFDNQVQNYYNEFKVLNNDKLGKQRFNTPLDWNDLKMSTDFSAPTQSLLQKWLRETKGIHVVVNVGLPHKANIAFYSNVVKFGKHHKNKFKSEFYRDYEEALEKGLTEALKLIEG